MARKKEPKPAPEIARLSVERKDGLRIDIPYMVPASLEEMIETLEELRDMAYGKPEA